MRTRLESGDWPDCGIHWHEATTADHTTLVNLDSVFFDRDIMLQLCANFDHTRH